MGASFINYTGMKIGRLTILSREGSNKWQQCIWLCKCDCGKNVIRNSHYLKTHKYCSCGCANKKDVSGTNNPCYRHGLSGTTKYKKLSSILGSMRCRCYNINNKKYKNYGERGIKICNEWIDKENGFMNFYNWAIQNGYKEGLSIDRINNNGNYEPGNCRWVNNKKQSNNRRSNHLITYNNETHTMMEWSEILNVNYNTLRGRINNYKWDIQKAFETPFK